MVLLNRPFLGVRSNRLIRQLLGVLVHLIDHRVLGLPCFLLVRSFHQLRLVLVALALLVDLLVQPILGFQVNLVVPVILVLQWIPFLLEVPFVRGFLLVQHVLVDHVVHGYP